MTANPNVPEVKHEGWRQSSTCRAVENAGKAAGREYGLTEAKASTLARLLNAQAKQKFGGPHASGRATLDGLAEAFAGEQLEGLADRLLGADSWASWLEGVVVPAKAPGLPEYTKDLEFDFEKSGPSIDTHAKARMAGGKDAIIHLRIQKWYQPNLDAHLFEESLKVERKFGTMPMVAVCLLWPPAEGPGMTGRYEERDAKNKVKRVFTYTIRRAWEMDPEEATKSVGTMLLAPLTKDSRRRMPEIVQMIKNGLDRNQANAETRDNVWDAVYWSMGLICEARRITQCLGRHAADHPQFPPLPLRQRTLLCGSIHRRPTRGRAFDDRPRLVRRQATQRFGPSPAAEATITAMTSLEELERLSSRVLTAADWEAMMAKG